jgi:antitoxin (DNA-binding transcriptional repressor) of toxin-antitoxin stability system
MAENVIHMSEKEAAETDVATLLKRVDEGAEIIIERESRPVAILRSVKPHPGRLLSESIALAEAHGSKVTLDGEFGRDLEEIVKSHSQPLDSPEWD